MCVQFVRQFPPCQLVTRHPSSTVGVAFDGAVVAEEIIPVLSFSTLRPAFARRPMFQLEPLEARRLLAAEGIWIEGEAPAASTFNQDGWYRTAAITRNILSPGRPGTDTLGDWHVHFTNGPSTAVATYNVNVTQGGRYDWWIRLNSFSNAYSYS